MKIQIARLGNTKTIGVSTDFRDIKSVGEITHVLAELEVIKLKLIKKFMKMNNGEDNV